MTSWVSRRHARAKSYVVKKVSTTPKMSTNSSYRDGHRKHGKSDLRDFTGYDLNRLGRLVITFTLLSTAGTTERQFVGTYLVVRYWYPT